MNRPQRLRRFQVGGVALTTTEGPTMRSLSTANVRAMLDTLRINDMLPTDIDSLVRLGTEVHVASASRGPVLGRWRIWGVYVDGRKELVVRARLSRHGTYIDVDEAERAVHWEPGA